MDGSQWAGSPYGSYSSEQANSNGNPYQQSPQGHRQSASHPVTGQDGTFAFPPPPAPRPAAPAQFDPRELDQFTRPAGEDPRAFIRTPSGQRPPFPTNGWQHYSFPAGNIAATEPAANNFHQPQYVQSGSASGVSTSESGYVSYNPTAGPLNASIQPQNPQPQSLYELGAGQRPAYDPFQRPLPPQTVISDTGPDRGGAPRLRGKAGPSRQKAVSPCHVCGKTMKNPSEAKLVLASYIIPLTCSHNEANTSFNTRSHTSVMHPAVPERMGSLRQTISNDTGSRCTC